MAASTLVKSFRDGTLTLTDGAALSFVLPFSKGDFSLSGMTAGQRECKVTKVRGTEIHLYPGDSVELAVSFTVTMADVADATNQTMLNVATKTGSWAAATSTRAETATACFCFDAVWKIEGTDYGDATDHTFTLSGLHIDSCDATEGDPNEMTFTGVVYGGYVAA